MKAIFPGQPAAKLQAVTTVLWEGKRIIAYISGSALIILRGPNDLLQSITHSEDEPLEAVAVSEASGKIATCTKDRVFIYDPLNLGEDNIRWSLQHTLLPICCDTQLTSLSWGQPREVLAGGAYLTLFDTGIETAEIWTRELANPVKFAAFTPDASFIASSGWQDRLVKIWTRLFLGENEERFDVSYLPHPATVTGARWHRRPNQEYHADTVLYTTCEDLRLRIWAATDPHGLQALQLWSELDLNECIVPQNPSLSRRPIRRFIFIMDGWEFEATVEHAIHKGGGGEREKHTREHLMDVAYRNPDVCVVMDDAGNMSAWGLERVGCKARQPNDIFNIAVMENLQLNLREDLEPLFDHISLCDFGGFDDGSINVLSHFFDGRVEWLKSPVDRLFDSSPLVSRFAIESIWTGHSEAISGLTSDDDLTSLLSQGSGQELVLWTQSANVTTTLQRACTFRAPIKVLMCSLSNNGQIAAVLHEDHLSMWDVSGLEAVSVFNSPVATAPGANVLIPCQTPVGTEAFLLISVEGAHLWSVEQSSSDKHGAKVRKQRLEMENTRDERFKSTPSNTSEYVVWSVDPIGKVSGWAIKHETASLRRKVSFGTGIVRSSKFTIGANHAAIVDMSQTMLSIWNVRSNDSEFEVQFASHEAVEGLEFGKGLGEYRVLAVTFLHKAFVYAQARRSFTEDAPMWLKLKAIDIGEYTNLPVLSLSWLINDEIVLGAGNQLLLFGNDVQIPATIHPLLGILSKDEPTRPLSLVLQGLNNSRISFDPELLNEQIYIGEVSLVDEVLSLLNARLKYWTLGEYLPGLISSTASENSTQALPNGNADDGDSDDTGQKATVFSSEEASSLSGILGKAELPYLSIDEQRRLSNFATSLGSVESHRRATDDAGLHYLLQLLQRREQGTELQKQLSWRDIVSALHSTSQEVMLDLTARSFQGKLLWRDAKRCGLFMWLTDINAVRAQFETIARNEYTKTEEKNPVDCTLYYLALRKKPVLIGLWRMASWNKEQKATQRMLANNFNDPRWKTAAMKNAYALLGLRRFEYAAAFFLLADQPKDAVNVLASRANDIQLAIAVARVYEGDESAVLKDLLQDIALTEAARTGNRWFASWAFWMLGERSKALRALIEPLEELVDLKESARPQAKSCRNNEPALIYCYAMLRDKIQKTPGDKTLLLSPKAEHDLVMRSAMGYMRAGCDHLALNLVRNFRFSKATVRTEWHANRVAHAEDSGADEQVEAEQPKEKKAKQAPIPEPAPTTLDPPTQRQKVVAEPSTASILDSFDF